MHSDSGLWFFLQAYTVRTSTDDQGLQFCFRGLVSHAVRLPQTPLLRRLHPPLLRRIHQTEQCLSSPSGSSRLVYVCVFVCVFVFILSYICVYIEYKFCSFCDERKVHSCFLRTCIYPSKLLWINSSIVFIYFWKIMIVGGFEFEVTRPKISFLLSGWFKLWKAHTKSQAYGP